MAKQELTDPKTSPDGKESINIGSVDTEQASISNLDSRPTESEMPRGIFAVDGQVYIRTEV